TAYPAGQNPPADLSVFVSKASSGDVTAGQQVEYCVSYANLGPVEAKSAALYVSLPDGASAINDPLGNALYNRLETDILWLLNDLPAGQQAIFRLPISVPSSYQQNQPFEITVGIDSGVTAN